MGPGTSPRRRPIGLWTAARGQRAPRSAARRASLTANVYSAQTSPLGWAGLRMCDVAPNSNVGKLKRTRSADHGYRIESALHSRSHASMIEAIFGHALPSSPLYLARWQLSRPGTRRGRLARTFSRIKFEGDSDSNDYTHDISFGVMVYTSSQGRPGAAVRRSGPGVRIWSRLPALRWCRFAAKPDSVMPLATRLS